MFLPVPINSDIIEEHDQKHTFRLKKKRYLTFIAGKKSLDTITQH